MMDTERIITNSIISRSPSPRTFLGIYFLASVKNHCTSEAFTANLILSSKRVFPWKIVWSLITDEKKQAM